MVLSFYMLLAASVLALSTSPSRAAAEGRLIATWEGHRAAIRDVDFSPDGTKAASASDDETIRIWDVATGKTLAVGTQHRDFVDSIAFTPDGKRLVTGSADGTVGLWDAATGKRLKRWVSQHPGAIQPGDEGSELRVIDYGHDGSEIRSFLVPDERSDALDISPDGRWAVSGGRYQQIVLFDLKIGTVAAVWTSSEFIYDVAFSTDSTRLLTANWSKVIELRKVPTGKSLGMFFGHAGVVQTVSYSPDGRTVLSGSRDRTIKLWDAATRKTLATWKGHKRPVTELEFSPDGAKAASVSEDTTLRIWEVATGKELAVLKGHAGSIFDVAYSPDGTKVLTSGADRTVRLWDVSGL